MIPVLIPELPEADKIIPYLRRIDASRTYSNYGPLASEFSVRLASLVAERSGSAPLHATITSNGTTAIEVALRYRTRERIGKFCLLPSYTFIATAHAAANVGLLPFFADVDPQTLALTPAIAERSLSRLGGEVAAIVVVSPYGAPIDSVAWEAFEARHGVPVLFDAAASTLNTGRIGSQPVCVSLHATKAFGIGEGGAIFSTDAELAATTTAMTGFGFTNKSRVSVMRGGNYRISEYTAAVGLALLDELEARIARLRSASLGYLHHLAARGVRMQEGFGTDWLTMTVNVLLDPQQAPRVTDAFDTQKIAWRRWYGLGCHTHPAFAGCEHDGLAATSSVAEGTIGVPFFPGIKPDQIARVCACIEQGLAT